MRAVLGEAVGQALELELELARGRPREVGGLAPALAQEAQAGALAGEDLDLERAPFGAAPSHRPARRPGLATSRAEHHRRLLVAEAKLEDRVALVGVAPRDPEPGPGVARIAARAPVAKSPVKPGLPSASASRVIIPCGRVISNNPSMLAAKAVMMLSIRARKIGLWN